MEGPTKSYRGVILGACAGLVIVLLVIEALSTGSVTTQSSTTSSLASSNETSATLLSASQTTFSVSTQAITYAGSGQLGSWNSTTAFPGANGPSSCVTSETDIYCVGGNGNETFFAPISSVGVGQWSQTSDYPMPISLLGCVENSNYIFCVGGESNSAAARAIDQYGRTADAYFAPVSQSGIGQWTSTTSFPYVAADPRCMTSSSYIYCVEPGFNDGEYNETGLTFSAPLSSSGIGAWVGSPGPQTMTAGCSAVGGHVYCFGGGNCPPGPPPSNCYSPSYFAGLTSTGASNWGNTTELPTAGFAIYVAAESYIYYLSQPDLVAQASGSGLGNWTATTNLPGSFSPGACTSSGAYIYCIGGSSSGAYFAQVGGSNPNAIVLENPPPYPLAWYVVPAYEPGGSGCMVSSNGVMSGGICEGNTDINDAFIFNCATSAATTAGCVATVLTPGDAAYNFNVTIWYPDANATTADTNCAYLAPGAPAPTDAWCASLNATSFIIAEPVELSSG